MIANDFGLDFERIRTALAHDYPRAADMPGAGFAAGPCLLKDTMQLAAFNNNNFTLGHASMMVNEGLPLYLVARLEQRFDLATMTVGILGMAFKGESDDIRSSLSYKLKRLLRFKAERVLCTDPYVSVDPDLAPLEDVLAQSDLLIVATPHRAYRGPRHRPAGHRHVEPARPRESARDEPARLGRHPRLQRGRRRSRPSSTCSSTPSRCPARCSRCTTRPRTRPPVPREVRRAATRA